MDRQARASRKLASRNFSQARLSLGSERLGCPCEEAWAWGRSNVACCSLLLPFFFSSSPRGLGGTRPGHTVPPLTILRWPQKSSLLPERHCQSGQLIVLGQGVVLGHPVFVATYRSPSWCFFAYSLTQPFHSNRQ